MAVYLSHANNFWIYTNSIKGGGFGVPLSEDPKICLVIKSKDKKFTLEQALKAQRGSRGIALLFISSRWGWVVNATPSPLYRHARDPRASLDTENLAPTEFHPWTVQSIAHTKSMCLHHSATPCTSTSHLFHAPSLLNKFHSCHRNHKVSKTGGRCSS